MPSKREYVHPVDDLPLHERKEGEDDDHGEAHAADDEAESEPLENGGKLGKNGSVRRFFDGRSPCHVVTERLYRTPELAQRTKVKGAKRANAGLHGREGP